MVFYFSGSSSSKRRVNLLCEGIGTVDRVLVYRGKPTTQKQWLESQRATIKAALAKCGGKIYGKGGAAELLGLRPATLSSRVAALKINRKGA